MGSFHKLESVVNSDKTALEVWWFCPKIRFKTNFFCRLHIYCTCTRVRESVSWLFRLRLAVGGEWRDMYHPCGYGLFYSTDSCDLSLPFKNISGMALNSRLNFCIFSASSVNIPFYLSLLHSPLNSHMLLWSRNGSYFFQFLIVKFFKKYYTGLFNFTRWSWAWQTHMPSGAVVFGLLLYC